jgi:hypothetical protein
MEKCDASHLYEMTIITSKRTIYSPRVVSVTYSDVKEKREKIVQVSRYMMRCTLGFSKGHEGRTTHDARR